MSEIWANGAMQDDWFYISVPIQSMADAIENRLNKYNIKWEWAEYQQGDFKFKIDKNAIRSPKLWIQPKRG